MLTTFLWHLQGQARVPKKKMKGTHLMLTSQTSCRVMLIGIVFSVLHTAGILVSAYLMTERLLEPDLPEKPVFHVCTEALFCPFYRILTGLNGIAVQLLGSGKNFLASYNVFKRDIFLWGSRVSRLHLASRQIHKNNWCRKNSSNLVETMFRQFPYNFPSNHNVINILKKNLFKSTSR